MTQHLIHHFFASGHFCKNHAIFWLLQFLSKNACPLDIFVDFLVHQSCFDRQISPSSSSTIPFCLQPTNATAPTIESEEKQEELDNVCFSSFYSSSLMPFWGQKLLVPLLVGWEVMFTEEKFPIFKLTQMFF